MQCKKCGTIIKDGEKFCGNCGEVVTQVDSSFDSNNQPVNNQNAQNVQPTSVNVSQGTMSQQQIISNTNQEATVEQPTSDWIGDNNKKDNKKKSNIGIVMFLIIIISLSVGGVFYFLNKNESEQKNNQNDDSSLDNSVNDNNNDNNDDNNNQNKLNNNISSSDLELLKIATLSEYFQKQKDELDKASSNYSHETYYEGSIGQNINPIIFKIENGNLVLYQLEKAQPMTKQNYNCEEVECIKQTINLNNEKAKYISIDHLNWDDYNINIMVLTENQNIYEGIIPGEDCESLECKYNVQLKKVDTNYKFKEIIQINTIGSYRAINYGLTTNNELIRTSDLTVGGNTPLLIYTYATITPSGFLSTDGKIFDNPLQVAIYSNGTLGIGNYDKSLSNTKKFYNILKEDGTKVVAKQIFTTNNCDTFILGMDNYLYKTNLNSCNTIITSDIKVSKYTEKKVNSIDYDAVINQSNGNVVQMTMKQMRVVAEPLNINIQYEDGTSDFLQIDRNFAGQYYIIFN